MQENLKKVEQFFKYDLEVKKILHDCVLKETDSYNNEYLSIYKDKLYNSLKDLEFYILRIIDLFFSDESLKKYKC